MKFRSAVLKLNKDDNNTEYKKLHFYCAEMTRRNKIVTFLVDC